MSRFIRRLLEYSARQPTAWRLFWRPIVTLSDVGRVARLCAKPAPRNARDPEIAALISPDLIVRYGPFAGMQYPNAISTGSVLCPKLIGCYESELHPFFATVGDRRYSGVVDIGCAEGYYAVGLAKLLPAARVHAYDLDITALGYCALMASTEGVIDRMAFGLRCSPEDLLTADYGPRPLIVCDCEGAELDILTRDVIARRREADFVVETHDFVRAGSTETLLNRFGSTHDVEIVESLDDDTRFVRAQYPELEKLDETDRRRAVAEVRPTRMHWLIARSKIAVDLDTGPETRTR